MDASEEGGRGRKPGRGKAEEGGRKKSGSACHMDVRGYGVQGVVCAAMGVDGGVHEACSMMHAWG